MPSGSTVKRSLERLTSGGRSAMAHSRHSPMYSAIFSLLSSTLVSSAAIYSFGKWHLKYAVWYAMTA